MVQLTQARARELFGAPEAAAERLRAFRESAAVFSSSQPRLISEYPQEWVAVYGGEVRAHAADFDALLAQVDAAGLPRHAVLVRFVEQHPRAMIL